MIINKYKFTLNNEGFIVGFYSVEDGEYDYEGQMANYPDATRGWTKFINGQFVEDATKKQEIENEETKQARIAELKGYLNETDYIYAKCTETGEDVNVVYAEVIANRKAWRKEIQDLEQ